jgi:hypothetical protein
MLPLDSTVQAEYEDGYILDETEHDDVAQFGDGNIFRDILNRLPEADHGRMVRFTCFWKNQAYHVDWTELPDNARPIRFRHGYYTRALDGSHEESGWSGVDFGFQYNDEDGANQQEVLELR